MPYIGTQPLTGQFKKLDAITVVNGQAAYTMQYNSSNYKPATANALLVSVNGVIQAAGDAYTINGSTITFTENLVTGDTIDFIIALGDTGSAVTPVDGSVTTAKLANDAVTSDKLAHDIAVQTSLSVPLIKDSAGTNSAITVASNGVVTENQKPLFFAHDVTNSSGASGWKTLDWKTREQTHKIDWDATNYFIKPTVAGYYHISFNHGHTSGGHDGYNTRIQHSVYGTISTSTPGSSSERQSINAVSYFDGVDDYITTDVYHTNASHGDDNTDRICNVGVFLVKGD